MTNQFQNNSRINIANVERAASVIGRSLLVYSALRHWRWLTIATAVTGAALIRRGVTGHCEAYGALGFSTRKSGDNVSVPYRHGIRVHSSITVNKPRFEVYSFWRALENLPSFMQHLEKVRETGKFVSHWEARTSLGQTVAWDAEMITDDPGQLIAWRSLPGADVDNAGSVRFADVSGHGASGNGGSGNRGTEVHVELSYVPPGGVIGAWLIKALGQNPKEQIQQDLRHFKMMIETGEVPQTQRETRKAAEETKQAQEVALQDASEASFPASDAPAYI